jgi:UDP-glucuronate decarboxylase
MKDRGLPVAVVAGGAGFIGSHLCDRLLERGYAVLCLDSLLTGRSTNIQHLSGDPRFTFVQADVIEPLPAVLGLSKGRIRRVYNLACAASPPHYQADPEHTLLTNVIGTRHLLQLAEAHGARFLQASTSEVYGDPHVHPQTENYWGNVNPTGPRACYDEGKRAAETLTYDFARAGRVEVRVARIFNTYGPRMRADDGRVVSNVVTQALSGRPITVYGSGQQTRSFCFIDDLVDGLLKLMEHDADGIVEPVNLGNPVELQVNDLVQRVLAATASASPVVEKALPVDDPQRRKPDIARAERLLHWVPATPLAKGLALTIGYFREELARQQAAGSVEHALAARSEHVGRGPAPAVRKAAGAA